MEILNFNRAFWSRLAVNAPLAFGVDRDRQTGNGVIFHRPFVTITKQTGKKKTDNIKKAFVHALFHDHHVKAPIV